MTNFGVELFLKTFLEYARKPAGRSARMQREGSPLLSSVSAGIDEVLPVVEETDDRSGSASETGEGTGIIDSIGQDEERTTIFPDRLVFPLCAFEDSFCFLFRHYYSLSLLLSPSLSFSSSLTLSLYHLPSLFSSFILSFKWK